MVALAANFGIALAKFAAAAWTHSSAMLSEAIHSLVGTSNQALLLYGLDRARRPADAQHPAGYAREVYFWSFVVAVLLFSMGAGVSIYEGIEKLRDPHPIRDFWVNYTVLGIALALQGFSAYRAIAAFGSHRGPRGWPAALRASRDAALFTVLLETVAAIAGLLIAFVALLCVQVLGWEQADAVASILIGLLLATVAAFMSVEVKGLLVGETAAPAVAGPVGAEAKPKRKRKTAPPVLAATPEPVSRAETSDSAPPEPSRKAKKRSKKHKAPVEANAAETPAAEPVKSPDTSE